jgi:hypothetical protein
MIRQAVKTRVLGPAAMAAALVALPSGAAAQSPGTSAPADTRPPHWEMIGGFEGDTHDVSYSFIGPGYNHPISEKVAITGKLTARYLEYEFRNGEGGETRVSSPGFAPQVGLRFGRSGRTVRFTVGYASKREHRTITDRTGRAISDAKRWRNGVALGTDLYYNLTRRDNIHAMVHFGTEDNYLWSRAGYKRQVSNLDWRKKVTLYVGGEGITQGNEDIWSNQVGALAEVLLVPARLSVMFRSGYKHSSFDRGDDKKGPYFALGLYKRF